MKLHSEAKDEGDFLKTLKDKGVRAATIYKSFSLRLRVLIIIVGGVVFSS